MVNLMAPPPAPRLDSGSFPPPLYPPSSLPRFTIFTPVGRNTSSPSAPVVPTLNVLGPVLPGTQARVIAWHTVGNNNAGSPPGTRHPLRKIKMPKSIAAKMREAHSEAHNEAHDEIQAAAPEFDYGVSFPRPNPLPKPLSPVKKPLIVEGYNPDGSLRFAPYVSSPRATPSLSANNNFVLPVSCDECGEPQFSIFNKFPLEIRLKIWTFALPSDRIVKISKVNYMAPGFKNGTYEDGEPRGPFTIQCSQPGVLGACSESRNVALKSYKLAFDSRLENRPIYFDFSCDILFFEDTKALDTFTGYPFDPDRNFKKLFGDLLAIEKMIIGGEVTRITISLLGLYNNLKSVTFQEQELKTGYGTTRLFDREALALRDLWKPKREGGAGRGSCMVMFESELLLKLVAENPVWRKGMLDM